MAFNFALNPYGSPGLASATMRFNSVHKPEASKTDVAAQKLPATLPAIFGKANGQNTAIQGIAGASIGKIYQNGFGDTVTISEAAQAMLSAMRDKSQSGFIGQMDTASIERPSLNLPTNELDLANASKNLAKTTLNVNYNDYAEENHSQTRRRSLMGQSYYSQSASPMYAGRRGLSTVQSGINGALQERDILINAGNTRKEVFSRLNDKLKSEGITIPAGTKLDFTVNEKGEVKVKTDANVNAALAKKVEEAINSDKDLGHDIKNLLALSGSSFYTDPAMMRLHIDGLLRENLGIGIDNLQWDDDGNLVPPSGMEQLLEEYPGLTGYIADLKYLEETHGSDYFKKEFTFSITANGILDNDMTGRASKDLFSKNIIDIMHHYDEGDTPAETHNWRFESSDYHQFEELRKLISEKGTSVYISTMGENYVIGENGDRKDIEFDSENLREVARYLIEDHLIETGEKGDISDYQLKIDKQGSYRVVKVSESGDSAMASATEEVAAAFSGELEKSGIVLPNEFSLEVEENGHLRLSQEACAVLSGQVGVDVQSLLDKINAQFDKADDADNSPMVTAQRNLLALLRGGAHPGSIDILIRP